MWKRCISIALILVFMGCRAHDEYQNETKQAKRIISLSCSITDTLYKIGAADRVVGITSYCKQSVGINDKPVVGRGFGDINIEAVIRLNPDLIICWQGKDEKVLRDRGFRLYLIRPHDLREVIRTVEKLGVITGKTEEAGILADKMRKRLSHVKKTVSSAAKRPKVYFENGRPFSTRSEGSLADDMIQIAGGYNIAKNMGIPFPRVSSEFVIEASPEVVILENSAAKESVMKRSGWSDIPAVKSGRIHVQKAWYTHYSYRCIDGLEMYARWIHPELFRNNREEIK